MNNFPKQGATLGFFLKKICDVVEVVIIHN
jgi:hypothetical protein